MNTITASFDTAVRQMTEMSQQKTNWHLLVEKRRFSSFM